tara:strand:- start:66 stop:371 length:306 start_codon:yes stop_codon:yes gene_type:complete
MKITKRQLRRIIKEEKSRLMKEAWGGALGLPDTMDARARGEHKKAAPPESEAKNMVQWKSNGDIKKFTQNLEYIIEYGGMDFDDVQIKAAVASALRNLGIK